MKFIYVLICCIICANGFSQVNVGKSRDTVGVYSKVEIEAQFKDTLGWRKYLERNLRYPDEWRDLLIRKKIKKDFTTVTIRFIVCTDGGVCEVAAEDGTPDVLAKEAVRIIKKSNGKWQAGIQDGKAVKSYHEQKITFAYIDN